MKTSKLRKLFQRPVAVVMAALLTVGGLAGMAAADAVKGPVIIGPGPAVTYDGDIVSEGVYALFLNASGTGETSNDVCATVKGDVKLNDEGQAMDPEFTAVRAQVVDGNASAVIEGNVVANAPNRTTYGLYAYANESGLTYVPSIHVKGTLSVTGLDASGIQYYNGGTVTLDKAMTVTGEKTAYGVYAGIWGPTSVSATVSGNITVEGGNATGVLFYTSDSDDTTIKATAKIGGNITTKGGASSDGLALCNFAGTIDVEVTGDITAELRESQADRPEASGIRFFILPETMPEDGTTTIKAKNITSADVGINFSELNMWTNTFVLVKETIHATNYGVLFPYDAAEMDGETALTSEMVDDYPIELTTWKIESESGTIAAVGDGYGDTYFEGDSKLEPLINYIIKSEQPEAGGTFKLVNEDGDEFGTSFDYPVAHVGDKIYIKPNLAEDYEIVAAYNGKDTKTELSKDGDQYYLEVPSGGGIYITVELAKTAFDITFADEDGTELKKVTVNRGEMPSYGNDDPTKKEDVQYTYKFSGWTPEIVKATEDATYEATYEGTLRNYELTFDLDGGTLNGQTGTYVMKADYGTEITIPDAPTKEGYKFLYWQGSNYNPGDKYKVEGAHDFGAVWEKVEEEVEPSPNVEPSPSVEPSIISPTPQNQNESVPSPQTADNSPMGFLLVLFVLLTAVVCFAVARSREEVK